MVEYILSLDPIILRLHCIQIMTAYSNMLALLGLNVFQDNLGYTAATLRTQT